MNLNTIPIIGWIIDLFLTISMSIPFWFIWKVCSVGEIYFYFLPERYLTIGFWETVGLFIILSILKSFSPFNVDSSSKVNESK